MTPATAASAAPITKVIEIVASTSMPKQRRHLAVLLAGALRPPERGVLNEIPEGHQQDGGDHHDQDLAHRQGDVIAASH